MSFEFQPCMDLNRIARPLWETVFKEFYGSNFIKYENFEDRQEKESGAVCDDAIVTLNTHGKTTNELKTVWQNQAYDKGYLFVEEIGNKETYEMFGDKGSGIENCNSQVWAYGSIPRQEPYTITKYNIYDILPFKKWFTNNKENYKLVPIQNPGYITLGRPIPEDDIIEFERKKEVWRYE